jgi:ribosome-binding factor A
MDPRRSERVSGALREELEEILRYEISDPRIDVAAVAEVLISPDGKRARVRLILNGDAPAQKDTLEALGRAKGYIRHVLGQRVDMFRVPDLHFEAALSPQLSPRVNSLLKRVRRGRPREDGEGSTDEGRT